MVAIIYVIVKSSTGAGQVTSLGQLGVVVGGGVQPQMDVCSGIGSLGVPRPRALGSKAPLAQARCGTTCKQALGGGGVGCGEKHRYGPRGRQRPDHEAAKG